MPKVKRHGSGKASAPCPAHNGKGYNCHIKEYPTGDAWPKCFSMGCTTREIMQAIGLELKEGYANPANGSSLRSMPRLSERPGFTHPNGKLNVDALAESIEVLESEPIGRKMSDIDEEPIRWLWQPFIPMGMYTLIDGEEGIGKTYVTLAIAASVSRGRGLFGISADEHIAAGNVLLIATEDPPGQVVKPRLRLMGADMEKVIIVDEPISLNSSVGLLTFRRALDHHNPRLVIFDPLFSCIGGIDLNQDNQIRSVTSSLKSMAEEYNCAIVGVRHIGKSKGMGEARNAGLGGVAWRASARSNPLIGKNPENDRERAIVQTKTNLMAESPQAIGYVITGDGLQWTGPSHLTAAQMLSFKQQENHDERTAREIAVDFLREHLRNGQLEAKEVQKAAKDAGITEGVLTRARYQVCKKPQKAGFSGGWLWELK